MTCGDIGENGDDMTRRSTRRPPKYFPSIHAFAAVQSVLAPLLDVKTASFPPNPETVDIVKQLWDYRITQLAEAGYKPLQTQKALEKARLCPHRLFAPDEREGVPCNFDRICPFCWGLKSALTLENVLRTRDRHKDLRLWLVRAWRSAIPNVPNERGRIEQGNVALIAASDNPAGTLRNCSCWPVRRNPLTIARAVGWLRPYPTGVLVGPVDALLDSLSSRAGRHQSRTRGVFRLANAARQIGQCRKNLIAPTSPIEFQPGPRQYRLHEAELLAAWLPTSFDHQGFGRRLVEKRLGGRPYRLAWAGFFDEPTVPLVFNSPAKAFKPLLAAWSPHADGVSFISPRLGYGILRRPRSEELLLPKRLTLNNDGGPDYWDDSPRDVSRESVLAGIDDPIRMFFSVKGQTFVMEKLATWVECLASMPAA